MVGQNNMQLAAAKKDVTENNSRRGFLSGIMAIFGVAAMQPAYADGQFPLRGDESIMSQKAHGTSDQPVQKSLKFNVDRDTADRITNYNRNWAEFAGYAFQKGKVSWVDEMVANGDKEYTFYDSVTGKPLFVAPRGRTMN